MSNDPFSQNPDQSPSSEDDLAADVNAAQGASFQDDVQRLSDEIREANDRTLRAQAELENFRRRMRREMEDERKYASLALIHDMLAVVDNLDRAIEAADKNDGAKGLIDGVKMVQMQFLSAFEKHGCRRIGQVGEPFDPNEHQAIAQEASAEIPAGAITRVAQFGYRLHDRVVRPAQVLVSTGSS